MNSSRSSPSSAGRSSSEISTSSNHSHNDEESLGMALLKSILISSATYIFVKTIVSNLVSSSHPSDETKPDQSALQKLERILSRRQKSSSSSSKETPLKISTLRLSKYEQMIASDVIDPSSIQVSFRDIGGINEIKSEIWDLVILPLLHPHLFNSPSGLVSPPRGILLYGAPGTGKTMLAKAIAKESRATFINVRLSSIMNKWFGESNKIIDAIFSLATKLSPSVVFIDELDTFLNQRDGTDAGCVSSMKSEFLTLWDGMTTNAEKPVMVLGATNRPQDIDAAVLRRMPRTFEIGLPDGRARLDILKIILEKQDMTDAARTMLGKLASVTKGYSGSDLKELCRAAAMEPVRELTKKGSVGKDSVVRPIDWMDFANAVKKVRRSGESASDFGRRESLKMEKMRSMSNARRSSHDNILDEFSKSMRLLQMVMNNGSVTTSQTDDLDKSAEPIDEDNSDLPSIPSLKIDEEKKDIEEFS